MTDMQPAVTNVEVIRSRYQYRAGSLPADEHLDTLLTALRADERIIREHARQYLAALIEECPGRADDVARVFRSMIAADRELSPGTIENFSQWAVAYPHTFAQAGAALAEDIAPSSDTKTPESIAMAFFTRLGAAAPGAIKPAVGSLTEFLMDAHGDATRGAAWVLLRAAREEPAVVRPFIAERLWQLDASDPTVVVDALHGLGAIGWILPDEIPAVERLYPHLSATNPEVRAAALEAIGRIAGRPPIDETPYGFASSDSIEPVMDLVVGALESTHDDVRTAALAALSWISETNADLIEPHSEALRGDGLPMEEIEDVETLIRIASTLSEPPIWSILATVDNFTEVISVETLIPLLESINEIPRPTDCDPLLPLILETIQDEALIDSRILSYSELRCLDLIADRAVETNTIDHEIEQIRERVAMDPTDVTSGEIGLLTSVCLGTEMSTAGGSQPVSLEKLLESFTAGLPTTGRSQRYAICRSLDRICSETTGYEQRCAEIVTANPYYTYDCAAITGPILAVAEQRPRYVDAAIRQLSTNTRLLDRERESGESLKIRATSRAFDSALVDLCSEAPEVAHDSVEHVVDIIARAGSNAEAASRALIEIRKSESDPDPQVTERLIGLLDVPAVEEVFVPISVAILLGDPTESQWNRAVKQIQSVVHRDYDTLDTLSALDTSCAEAIQAIELSVSREVLKSEPAVAAAHITAVPDSTAILQSKLVEAFSDIYTQVGSSTALTALATVAEETPAVASAVPNVLNTLYISGVPDFVCDGLKIVQTATGCDTETLELWEHHPDPHVRKAVSQTMSAVEGESHPLAAEAGPSAAISPSGSTSLITACRRALAAGKGDTARETLRTGVIDGNVDRTAAVACLLGHASRVSDSEERDETLATVARLSDSVRTDQDAFRDVSGEGDTVTRGDPQTMIARCLTDESPEVRRNAAAYLVNSGVPPVDETSDLLGEAITSMLLDSTGPVSQRLLMMVKQHPESVDLETVIPRIADSLSGPFPTARVACDALRAACSKQPAIVEGERDALEQALAAKDERTRQLATSVFYELGMLDPERLEPSISRLVDRAQRDPANRAQLLRTIAAVDLDAITDREGLSEAAQAQLLTDSEDLTSLHAAGGVLVSSAVTDPELVASVIDESVAETLDDGEIDQLAVEYYIVRVVSALALDHPGLVQAFEEPIETTLENAGTYKSYKENTSERRELTVDPAAVREAAAIGVGRAGISVFETALESFPTVPGRPNLDPDAVAQYLVHAGPGADGDVLERIQTVYGPDRIDSICRSLAAISIPASAVEWERHRLTALGTLLPTVPKDRACRPAIETMFSALDASDMDVRKDAVESLRPVWERGPLVADEWLARSFEVLQDDAEAVQRAVVEQLPAVIRRSHVSTSLVTESLISRATTEGESISRRRGATLALGAVGTRMPTVRRRSTEACLTCLEDPDRYVRRYAAEALLSFGELSPALLTPIPGPVSELRDDGVPEIEALGEELLDTLSNEH